MVVATLGLACGPQNVENGGLNGTVHADGSSTVFPITEAVAEEFQGEHPGVRVTVGISGTGGGFKKFTVGETDINAASRTIKPSEIALATGKGIDFIELPVAFDGISVLVNTKNDFVHTMTVAELNKIWQPESTVKKWSDVRREWPSKPINLYGPGTDSGTFDYFTKAINGEERASRADFTASEDDNVLVQGIAGDENAMGYIGYAYYAENKSILKVVPIETETGPISPSVATINNGTYRPLSRPVFIYVTTKAADRPEVDVFVKYYIENAASLVTEVGYVPLPEEVYQLASERFENRTPGSIFLGKKTAGVDLVDILGSP
ncbi:MAG: phosphate ABC transporter substrate-binding protein [Solibacterales bacterium]|nr:phosphate ABC transporter substrate-binding protein [Bryobacterales bacterium]